MKAKTKGKAKKAEAEQPKKRGRPSAYKLETAVDICARLLIRDAAGNLPTLRDLCKADPNLPQEWTIYKWMAQNADFAQMYARAREERAHMIADEIIQIADTEEDPQRARVRIDARKWWVGKANAKHYGDKTQVDLTVTKDVGAMTDAELERIAAASSPRIAETSPGSTLIN